MTSTTRLGLEGKDYSKLYSPQHSRVLLATLREVPRDANKNAERQRARARRARLRARRLI